MIRTLSAAITGAVTTLAVLLTGMSFAQAAVTHPVTAARSTYSHNGEHEYFGIYTETSGNIWSTLRLTESGNVYLPAFQVVQASQGGWVYPNIGQGAEHGMVPYEGGRKTWYPVPAAHDGNPVVNLRTALTRGGSWNAGFDVWFEPGYDAAGTHQGQGGTEVMVWTAAMRNGRWASRGPGTSYGVVYEDGIWWNVNGGYVCQHGDCWHRIYFAAQRPMADFHGSLNPFFGQAMHFHALAHAWWLTGLDYGFEINSGGGGLAVTSYLLNGVQNARAQEEYGS
jgi:hypothetical protein